MRKKYIIVSNVFSFSTKLGKIFEMKKKTILEQIRIYNEKHTIYIRCLALILNFSIIQSIEASINSKMMKYGLGCVL